MEYICKQCNKVIKRKPKIYDDYYFCNNDKCVWDFINIPTDTKHTEPKDSSHTEVKE